MSLDDLRDRLNALDADLLRLLRERADISDAVGHFKRGRGLAYHQPDREREILDKVAESDLGKFPTASAQWIFREILAASRAIQQPAPVAYLGPRGSYTELAALNLYGHSGQYEFCPQPSIDAVFEIVKSRKADFGIVPIENSTAGTIREVLDLLVRGGLTIVGETHVDVHHCLMSHAELQRIRVIYSKDTVFSQCSRWLAANLPHAKQVPVHSTTTGAERAAETKTGAAIAPELAAELYNLPLRARSIEDRTDNRTRFFALGHETPEPSACDKTSLLLAVSHRPGSLMEALTVLRDFGLNMTLIESRPSPFQAFEYVFFIDVEGHIATPEMRPALEELGRVCLMTQILGSYPRAAG